MHADIEERREVHDVKAAEKQAERPANYAAIAVDFALDAIVEAEAAVLEAEDAWMTAEEEASGHEPG